MFGFGFCRGVRRQTRCLSRLRDDFATLGCPLDGYSDDEVRRRVQQFGDLFVDRSRPATYANTTLIYPPRLDYGASLAG